MLVKIYDSLAVENSMKSHILFQCKEQTGNTKDKRVLTNIKYLLCMESRMRLNKSFSSWFQHNYWNRLKGKRIQQSKCFKFNNQLGGIERDIMRMLHLKNSNTMLLWLFLNNKLKRKYIHLSSKCMISYDNQSSNLIRNDFLLFNFQIQKWIYA